MLFQPPLPPKYDRLSPEELCDAIAAHKRCFGSRLIILGHHYQQDEVIRFADFTGDSLKLSQVGADQRNAEFIVFCGVHFMAESADILTDDGVLIFSCNAQGFRLDEKQLKDYALTDITSQTTTVDFRRRPAHVCWCLARHPENLQVCRF